jgi:hypothetical protein
MFRLNGEVSSESLDAIQPVLIQLVDGQVTPAPGGLRLEGLMEGEDARDVNRRLLSALRRVDRLEDVLPETADAPGPEREPTPATG